MNRQQSVANMRGGFWQVLRTPLCHEKALGPLCAVLGMLLPNLVDKISVDGTAQTRQSPSTTCFLAVKKALQVHQISATSY